MKLYVVEVETRSFTGVIDMFLQIKFAVKPSSDINCTRDGAWLTLVSPIIGWSILTFKSKNKKQKKREGKKEKKKKKKKGTTKKNLPNPLKTLKTSLLRSHRIIILIRPS